MAGAGIVDATALTVQKQLMREQREDLLTAKLGLSFPYDWSNPFISDQALIINVLKRGIFEDICRICAHFGIDTVDAFAPDAFNELPQALYERMIANIRIGFSCE